LIADRIGVGRVLIVGLLLVALGTALTPFMTSTAGLIFAIGVLAAGGAGMAGPAVLMAATTRLVPAERRGLASGIVNAGGSFGQFIFAPLAQGITAAAGWASALYSLAAFTLLALPAAWVLRTRPHETPAALALPSYRWLCAGFFVCGFHVAFIATHLPGVVASCQLPPEVGAWSLAVIGLFNILGSLTIGWAIGYQGGRWRMKSLLSLIYAARALAVLVFVFAPKTSTTMLIFAAVIGFTYLSTVPPTAGLVARFFGPAHMAMLFGVVMLSHQIGGFLGAYLGGKSVEWTGNYDWMWWADIVLAVGAALAHLPIDEKKKPALAAAQPA
jgi:predicted MFS family arabinose efflux permease